MYSCHTFGGNLWTIIENQIKENSSEDIMTRYDALCKELDLFYVQ